MAVYEKKNSIAAMIFQQQSFIWNHQLKLV